MRAEIVVFGRVPMPGRVKTRLAQTVGHRVAAEIYCALLDHVLAEACAAGPAVVLSLADSEGLGEAWRPPPGVAVEIQEPGDLGARMMGALEEHFEGGADAVLLIGSDLPGLQAAMLREAWLALERVPVVLGPATDGGYWLLGQRRPARDLFSGVPWSSPAVLQVTRRRLRELAAPHEELSPVRDLDTIQDLEAVVADHRVDAALRRRLMELVRDRG